MKAALDNSALSAKQLVTQLEKDLCQFSGSGDPVDDITMLVAKKIA